MTGAATFLRQVPVLAGLPEQERQRLADGATTRHLRAGEWLMREGDAAESLFVVRAGRLEVVGEGPPQTLIRTVRRGDVLGELALLARTTRSTSVRARRDSELIEVGRDQFEHLIEHVPSFALGLTRALGTQLAASRTPLFSASPPSSVAVVSLDRAAPAGRVARVLADELAAHGSVARLADDGAERSAGDTVAMLDAAEREHDRVVVAPGGAAWTEVSLREAELVVAVTCGRPDAIWLERAAALSGCELVVAGPRVSTDVIDALQPREVQVLADDDLDRGVRATARRIAGRAIGVVLSGGGARAFAHLGVVEELLAAGVRIDRLGGVSLGSLVAAAFAAGWPPEAVAEAFSRSFVETNPTSDFTLPAYGLIRGRKTWRMIDERFGERRIEELATRFYAVSCDLVAREPVVHRTGPVRDAVYASLAIPAVFPPVATADGRLLVDGGVLDNLPVATMARSGEGPVIGVDVTGRVGQFRKPSRPRLARLGRLARRALTGSDAQIPRLGETVLRTVTVGSVDTVAAARLHADLVIAPRVEGVAMMDWQQLDHVREIGRDAARAALAELPAALRI